jgi:hypothetical protein
MNESESFMKINKFGDKIWTTNDGVLHRLDGPAVEYNGGSETWWMDGFRHRSDGPAVFFSNGHKEWHLRGILHREDGPAVIYPEGNKEWFINNVCYKTKEDYFDALSDEAKARCLFSEDFLNG